MIKWCNIDFDGPYSIVNWKPPFRAAVYAIMMKPNPRNKPDTYRILYFGQSSNLSERGFFRSHQKYICCIDEAGDESNLYIGIYLMPNSSEEERNEIEDKLIYEYQPVCNRSE